MFFPCEVWKLHPPLCPGDAQNLSLFSSTVEFHHLGGFFFSFFFFFWLLLDFISFFSFWGLIFFFFLILFLFIIPPGLRCDNVRATTLGHIS